MAIKSRPRAAYPVGQGIMRFRHFIVPSRRSRVVDGGRETRPATAALHRRYITVLGFIVYRHSFFFGPLDSVCPAFVLFPVLTNRVPTSPSAWTLLLSSYILKFLENIISS
ncbi:unnamed protein product [Macrosiphum euphorbiae]|uniref:Uncharacterized protein n=1 Tax=Macrosiphum euphorbiae TaxID=13131 RepID=A0AAV0XYL5_9HEMI|nr:unnamed protein product [Macrosiphum euphorbiae]